MSTSLSPRLLIFVVPLLFLPLKAPVGAQPPSSTCSSLTSDWISIDRDIAMRHIESIGDNSAPREQVRQAETANALARAEMTLQLMRDYHCALPKHAPGATMNSPAPEGPAPGPSSSPTPGLSFRERCQANYDAAVRNRQRETAAAIKRNCLDKQD